MRLDSIRRHLKSNHYSKRTRDITSYIMDFLDPPQVKALETRYYQADPSTSNSYIYQQTMPKNKEMFPWVLHALDTALMPPRVHKPHCLLVKEPMHIPFDSDSTEDLKDPRLDYYTPRTSPSLEKDYSELSELDQILHAQLEAEEVTTIANNRRKNPCHAVDNIRFHRNCRWLLWGLGP